MTHKIIFLILLALSIISGCNNKSAPSDKQPQGVIPQAQLDALNKAKNVENVLQQGAENENKQIDQQEQ